MDISVVKAVFLGLVQGIAEFLPISSTGHLAVFSGGDAKLGLFGAVVLHMGTLLSVLVYFRRDVWKLSLGGVRLAGASARAGLGQRSLKQFLTEDVYGRIALMVLVAMVPTAVFGMGLKHIAEGSMKQGNLKVVGAMFLVTAVLMFFADSLPSRDKKLDRVGVWDSLAVGAFQGLAAMPGLSRSGSTIFAGILRGIDREEAARFSFLLSIPAIAGAMIIEGHEALKGGPVHIGLAPAVLGVATAFVVGLVSLAIVLRIVSSRNLRYFTGYLVVAGLIVLIFMR
jgi:undecaprenyl-diphosphatase